MLLVILIGLVAGASCGRMGDRAAQNNSTGVPVRGSIEPGINLAPDFAYALSGGHRQPDPPITTRMQHQR